MQVILITSLIVVAVALQGVESQKCQFLSMCCTKSSWWWWRSICNKCFKEKTCAKTEWSPYSACNEKCEKTRTRNCVDSSLVRGTCKDVPTETVKCYEGSCLDAGCKKAHEKGRIHHSLHGTCVNFVTCHLSSDGKIHRASVKKCNGSAVWMDDIQGCVGTHDVTKCDSNACKDGEITPVRGDCKEYQICAHGAPRKMPCPPGTYFDPTSKHCGIKKNLCNM